MRQNHCGARRHTAGMGIRWVRPSAVSLAAFAILALGACSSANRPAWERSAVSSPAPLYYPPRPSPTTGALQPRPVPRPAIERAALPVSMPPQAPATSNSPPSPPSSVAARRTLIVPRPAAPATPRSLLPPSGAVGQQVAVAAPAIAATPAPPAKAADPLWAGVETHLARHEDTLIDLAVAHGLGFIEVVMANPDVDPWLPGEGTLVFLPKVHLPPDAQPRGIVINLPEQRLFYYAKGALVRSYPIGIGRDGHATPVGKTTIVRKQANPTWYPTASTRADDPTLPAAVPPGPDNPLGNRAMYLGWASYLIHGTNKEYSIGRRGSRGCIRMYSNDSMALFDRVAIGTPVAVVDQPIKLGWLQGALYIEASPTIAQVRQWEEKGKFDPVSPPDVREMVRREAGDAAGLVDWVAVDRAIAERRGIPTRITPPGGPTAVVETAESPPHAAAADDDSEDLVQWLRKRLGMESR
jgi:L,D-transpeptidase ErfK/SrfK